MAVYGLTGGIGAGKSTVCRMLQEHGITIVAADAVGRQVVAKGSPGLATIVATFGEAILDSSGVLDRRQLGTLVFSDVARRRQLEDIMHPLVKERSRAIFAELSTAGVPIIVYESALLFETERQHEMHGTILVTAGEHSGSRGCNSGIAPRQRRCARMQAQMSDDAKRHLADYVLDNNGDLQDLQRQVDTLVATLRQATR